MAAAVDASTTSAICASRERRGLLDGRTYLDGGGGNGEDRPGLRRHHPARVATLRGSTSCGAVHHEATGEAEAYLGSTLSS